MTFGRWQPLTVPQIAALFADAPFRWWISGGMALELHTGRSWRTHEDADVGIRRVDAVLLSAVLDGWDVHVASQGVLRPWGGAPLDAARNENNLWCRSAPSEPWALDVTISDGDDDEWVFRRDPAVRRPWNEAVLLAGDGVPFLAPELQLLFKSKDLRAKDDVDAREVIPT